MITGKDLIDLGYPEGKVIGLALAVEWSRGVSKADILNVLRLVQKSPESYIGNPDLGEVAREFLRRGEEQEKAEISLRPLEEEVTFRMMGGELIDENTREQMYQAMRLPISVWGALMPDAHLGYGLPVGGVLATEYGVIPWAVGVDISCMMRMSIFDLSSHMLGQYPVRLRNILSANTSFGVGSKFSGSKQVDHPVLDDPRWEATAFLRNLKDTAARQLGTSGSGNHFVEWGSVEPLDRDWSMLEGVRGTRLAILSHSGSRGVGFKIANHYAKLAEKELPQMGHMAWLPMGSEAGAEYWLSMELAGAFAEANHEVIHHKMADDLGNTPQLTISNKHNFAWKERLGDRDLIVHRKGATPAQTGVTGLIPGSMSDPGYVVVGKGAIDFLNSASHGAGRVMSRTQAKKVLDRDRWRRELQEKGVTLLGGDLDEASAAYKDIEAVIGLQHSLVLPVAKFTPRIVRMDSGGRGRR